MTTEADGTHPTGMHTCCVYFLGQMYVDAGAGQ